jgi:Tol biopolymer transport system component
MVSDRTNPETGNTDIFRVDVQIRGKSNSSPREPWQLTRDDKPDYSPVWSRRRDVIVFSNNESGAWNLYEMSARDGGRRTLILETEESKFATDWSRNEEFILYRSINPEGGYDLRVVRYFDKPPREEFGILPKGRRFDERDGQFSPDGKWIAYSSNEFDDQFEIFVLLFPKDLKSSTDRGVQISLRGGTQPRWGRHNPAGHPGATELYYLDLKGRLMRAVVSTGSDGQPAVVDRSDLFRTGIPAENPVGAYAQQYAVFEEGGKIRFLLNVPKIENPPPLHLIVDIDWKSRR